MTDRTYNPTLHGKLNIVDDKSVFPNVPASVTINGQPLTGGGSSNSGPSHLHGTTVPASSLGKDGDVYFQHA